MHKKGISLNSVEKSLSHSADKIRRRTLLCSERILVSKIFKQRRGKASRFCRNFFKSHRTEKTSPGKHSVFQKFSGREKYFMDKRGGGITIFRRKFIVSLYRTNSLENTLVFQKFFLSKIFMNRRGALRFCRNFSAQRTETKNFVRGPFCFPENFWYRKKIMHKRGHITIFSRNFYVSQCRKSPRGNATNFVKISAFKKFYGRKGGYHVFQSKIFGLTFPKNFVKELFSFSLISGIKKC